MYESVLHIILLKCLKAIILLKHPFYFLTLTFKVKSTKLMLWSIKICAQNDFKCVIHIIYLKCLVAFKKASLVLSIEYQDAARVLTSWEQPSWQQASLQQASWRQASWRPSWQLAS